MVVVPDNYRDSWRERQTPYTVVVAQLVRAPDCGSGGRRFETDLPPKNLLQIFALTCLHRQGFLFLRHYIHRNAILRLHFIFRKH